MVEATRAPNSPLLLHLWCQLVQEDTNSIPPHGFALKVKIKMVVLHLIDLGKADIPLKRLAQGLLIPLSVDQINQARRSIERPLFLQVRLYSGDLVGPLHDLHVRFIPQVVHFRPKEGNAAANLGKDGTRSIWVVDDLFSFVVVGDVPLAINTPGEVTGPSTEA